MYKFGTTCKKIATIILNVSGHAWGDQLRNVIVSHRSLGEFWLFEKFSSNQQQSLRQYYDANLLLVVCLSSDSYVSRSVRQEIEETLLLPISRNKNQS